MNSDGGAAGRRTVPRKRKTSIFMWCEGDDEENGGICNRDCGFDGGGLRELRNEHESGADSFGFGWYDDSEFLWHCQISGAASRSDLAKRGPGSWPLIRGFLERSFNQPVLMKEFGYEMDGSRRTSWARDRFFGGAL